MLKPQNNLCRSLFNLDGIWEYAKHPGPNPETGFEREGLLAVPASWNEQHNELFHYKGKLWYQKRFEFQKTDDKLFFLRFAGVLFRAEFYLNGIALGENIAGHLPVEFDVSALLNAGENLITVGVDGNIAEHQAIGKGDFYEYGGIHRSVTLEGRNKIHFQDIKAETSSSGKLKLKWQSAGGKTVRFSINGQSVSTASADGQLEKIIENIECWCCENPKLYTLKAELLDDCNNLCDLCSIKIGFRTFEVKGRKLFLNGKETVLKGFGKHEDFYVSGKGVNLALYIRDYELMRWCGANSFRTTHYPYSEEMLDLADEHGFLIIDEVPFVDFNDKHFGDKELLANAIMTIKRLIDRDFNHPSVVSWSMGNECETQMPESEAFFEEIFAAARREDPVRPLTYVAYTRPGQDHAYKFADIIGVNRYFGWYAYASWGSPVQPGDISGGVRMLNTELDKFMALYDKPLILSEFGVDCIQGTHSAFCQQFSEEFQSEFLERYIRCLQKRSDIAGMHVWCFADFFTNQDPLRVQGNRKGIFTRSREPKMAAFTVRKLWTGNIDSGVIALGDELEGQTTSSSWEEKGGSL